MTEFQIPHFPCRQDQIRTLSPVSSHPNPSSSLLVLEFLASLFWSRERTVRFLYVLLYYSRSRSWLLVIAYTMIDRLLFFV